MSKPVRYLNHPDKGVIAIYQNKDGETQAIWETPNGESYFINWDEQNISEMYSRGFTEVVI